MLRPSAWTVVTAAAKLPLTLIELKDHLRLNYGDNSSEGVTVESAALLRVDNTSFTVAGDLRDVYIDGRYLEIGQSTMLMCYVVSTSYAAGGDLTTVNVDSGVIDAGFTDVSYGDAFLVALIETATKQVEDYTHRKLITQTWDVFYPCFPGGRFMVIPFGAIQSVTTVKYIDEDETTNTMSDTEYGVDTDSIPGSVYLNPDESWTSDTLWPSNPVIVRIVTGYGDDNTDIPSNIQAAMKMIIDTMYENRETIVTGTIISENTIVESLLWPFRLDVF